MTKLLKKILKRKNIDPNSIKYDDYPAGYECSFDRWTREPEELYGIRNFWYYRLYLHYRRIYYAIKLKRWNHFCWYNIKGLIFNKNIF